jgi:kynureninase
MGSRLHVKQIKHGPPLDFKDDIRAYKKEYAQSLDKQDPLRHLRDEFIIPSKADLKRKTLKPSGGLQSVNRSIQSTNHLFIHRRFC